MTAPPTAAAPDVLPMIGFGEVRHTRLRPARNAFAYAGYFLMLPMRAMQDLHSPAARSCLARNRRAALSFYDADHGDGRAPSRGGALAWLDELLQQHGVDDATGEIWLHCYPRVLGYTFKPVSFWFCHRAANDQDGALRAIVCEVNNTFGERHCYLLDQPRWGMQLNAVKEFHVSPFLQVEGRYQFRFMRAQRADGEHTLARIDYHDMQGAMLQTSVSGKLVPISRQSVRKALWHYPAMTLGVITRIHMQAVRLWFKRVRFIPKPDAAAGIAVTRQEKDRPRAGGARVVAHGSAAPAASPSFETPTTQP
ncbi:MAG: DUF1365 domain-containing protein [Burkholderiaceae bacterium]